MANSFPPSSPLNSAAYLVSPLTTVLKSVDDPQSETITLHDLTEAYATFSRRIRLQAAAILSNDRVYPALCFLQAESPLLSLCLIRDIGRCLLNPLSIFSQPDSVSDDGLLIEEAVERAQAYAILSHHALVFLADIFTFSSLTKILFADQLSDLLREVLLILSTPHLPTPSSEKTWRLAIFSLVSQRLHPDVLLRHKLALKKVLFRLVLGTFDGHSFRIQGFKLLSVLLRTQHSEFVDCLIALYPHILTSLVEDGFGAQLQALSTLQSIAVLKRDSPDTNWSHRVISLTHGFIRSQSSRHRTSQGSSLQGVLTSAVAATDGHWDYRGPLWAMLVVACLIHLSDACIFTRPHSLKLLCSILGQATNHRRTYVRALHPHVWNCLIWCYSRLPPVARDPQTSQDIRRRSFLLLRQELKGGTATALIASILSSPEVVGGEVMPVLDIIKDLLSSLKESRIREGVRVFCRLLSAVNAAPTQDTRIDVRDFSGIMIRELFVGSLLDLPEAQTRALCVGFPEPDERFVRPFTEHQIRDHWDTLVGLWAHAINCTCTPSVRFQYYEDQLMAIWQVLLLTRSHLTSGSNSTFLTMSPTTADQMTSIVIKWITDTSDTTDQLFQLTLVHKLWSVFKHSYETKLLAPVAKSLLSAVLSKKYALAEEKEGEGVRKSWSALCVDLISVGEPRFIHSVLAKWEPQDAPEIQGRLWAVVAESWLFKSKERAWEDILSFLAVPIRLRCLELRHLDTWNKLFMNAVEIANSSCSTPHDTLNALFRSLGEDVLCLKDAPHLIPQLLRHFQFNVDNIRHRDFLGIINGLLVEAYPPTPEDHIIALPILEGLGNLIDSHQGEIIVQLLVILVDGLSLWIRDEAKMLLEQEHATLVHSIYCGSLIKLSALPPSHLTLRNLSSFLSSSFERMGYPPIGPLAFELFWRRGGYHDQDAPFKKSIPEEIKTCLKAWSDHCGDSLAEGLGSFMDSQSATRLFVPDSQSPDKGFFLDHGDSEFPRDMDLDEDFYAFVPPSSQPVPVVSSQHTLTVGVSFVTTPKASLRQIRNMSGSSEHVSIAALNIEQVAGQKRPCSGSGGNQVKRHRMDNDDESSTRNSCLSSISLGSQQLPTKPNQLPGHLVNGVDQQPGLPRPRRRLVVPPSPPGEFIVPETSSPASATTTPSPGHKISAALFDSGHGETEVEKDSLEMQPNLGPQGSELRHSSGSSVSSHRRLQSESAIESNPPSRPIQLRRNYTASERLDALQRAYSIVADSQGTSQVPLEELAHAAQITHKIGAKIAEQMSKKFPGCE